MGNGHARHTGGFSMRRSALVAGLGVLLAACPATSATALGTGETSLNSHLLSGAEMGASWAQVGPTTTKALDTPGGAQQNRCTIDLKLSAPSVVQASFRSTQPPSVLRERLFRPEDPTQFFSQELLAQSCYARAASSRGARGEEAMPLGVSGIASGV